MSETVRLPILRPFAGPLGEAVPARVNLRSTRDQGGFWFVKRWATNGSSKGMQYAGLLLYTLAEAVIFLPLIALAIGITGDGSLLFWYVLQFLMRFGRD